MEVAGVEYGNWCGLEAWPWVSGYGWFQTISNVIIVIPLRKLKMARFVCYV